MTLKLNLSAAMMAAAFAIAPITGASAHEFHHHHGGGPVLGLIRTAVAVATLPVRVAGGVVSAAVAPYPAYQAVPVYYATPATYAYAQPVYAQPVYAYPPQQPVYYAYPGQ